MNADRLNHWSTIYLQCLEKCMTEHPEDYYNPKGMPVSVAAALTHGNMMKAFQNGSYNHSGRAIKAACKAVGIKYTRKSIEAFLAGAD